MRMIFLAPRLPPAVCGVADHTRLLAENLVSRKERVTMRNRRTDGEGRFTYAGLIPGATYRLSVLGRGGVVLKKEFRAEG